MASVTYSIRLCDLPEVEEALHRASDRIAELDAEVERLRAERDEWERRYRETLERLGEQ